MKLLNVGCGGNRPGPPWTNLDCLREHLKPGTPERINLDKESNYIDHKLPGMPLPNQFYDGVLCSHVIEHFNCHNAVNIISDCRRILKPGGLLVVSVPDASYFLEVLDRDKPENAVELFGEPISADEPWQKSFFDYALFHREHQQILSFNTLKCLIIKAGFADGAFEITEKPKMQNCPYPALIEIEKIMNRRKFSLELVAVKSS